MLLALMNELGIKAEPALVSLTRGDDLNDRLPGLAVFDHVFVHTVIGRRDFWLDGTRSGDEFVFGRLGALIALRMSDEFGNQVRVGIANGLTRLEIEEVVTHSAAYVGFPAARAAMIVAAHIFEQVEVEDARSALGDEPV
jgi:hypothetical protein